MKKIIDKIRGIREKSKQKFIALITAIVFAGVILVIALASLAGFIGTQLNILYAKSFDPIGSEYTAYEDEDGYYNFKLKDANDDFSIMQLTDIHLGCGYFSGIRDRLAIKSIYKLADYSRPDLIVITGDMSYAIMGYPGNVNNARAVEIITTLLETMQIPYMITLGNHDDEVYNIYNREEIAKMYADENLKYSLFKRQTGGDKDVFGEGNSVIKLNNADNTINTGLIFIDSNAYIERKINIKGGYDSIHQDQIEWYKDEVDKLGSAPTLAFFHIPLPEFEDAWNEYRKGGSDAEFLHGFNGEKGVCAGPNSGMFDAILEKGSTKGVFVGHDHVNSFAIKYKGVVLSYGLSIDRLAYATIAFSDWQRGAKIINIKADSSFDIKQIIYAAIK